MLVNKSHINPCGRVVGQMYAWKIVCNSHILITQNQST